MPGKFCYQGFTSHLWTCCWNGPTPVYHTDHQAPCLTLLRQLSLLCACCLHISSALTNKNPDRICGHNKDDVSLHNHLNPPTSHHLLVLLFPSAFLYTHIFKTNCR